MIPLWVPGKFRLTNKMLSDLRAAGAYEATARERAWRCRPDHDRFAVETLGIRLAAKRAAAVALALRHMEGRRRVDVFVAVLGHHRNDPDSWFLLAKPAIDGLVDAGAIASDRRNLGFVGGRVCTSPADEAELCEKYPFVLSTVGLGRGVGAMLAFGGGARWLWS